MNGATIFLLSMLTVFIMSGLAAAIAVKGYLKDRKK